MTEYANHKDAAKVKSAYDRAKQLVADGMHPTDALREVAAGGDLSAEHVESIGHTLNQTIAASVELGDDRHENFDKADVMAVKDSMLSPTASPANVKEKPGKRDPDNDFSSIVTAVPEKPSEKTSSLSNDSFRKLTSLEKLSMLQSAEHVKSELNGRRELAFAEACRGMDKFASVFKNSDDRARTQSVMAVLSADPVIGDMVLQQLSKQASVDLDSLIARDMPLPEKCTDAAFEGHMCVQKFARFKRFSATCELVDKTAALVKEAGVFDVDTAESVVNTALNASGIDATIKGDDYKPLEDSFDPEYINKMRGLKAVDGFHNMLLFDPDVGRYDPHSILDAYNSVVQINPSAADNPAILRNMVLDRLARGNIVDPMSIQSEQRMAQAPLERKKLRSDIALNAAKVKSLEPVRQANKGHGEQVRKGLFGAIDSFGNAAKEVATSGINAASKLIPSSVPELKYNVKRTELGAAPGDEPVVPLKHSELKLIAQSNAAVDGYARNVSNLSFLDNKGISKQEVQDLIRVNDPRVAEYVGDLMRSPMSAYEVANSPSLDAAQAAALMVYGNMVHKGNFGLFLS